MLLTAEAALLRLSIKPVCSILHRRRYSFANSRCKTPRVCATRNNSVVWHLANRVFNRKSSSSKNYNTLIRLVFCKYLSRRKGRKNEETSFEREKEFIHLVSEVSLYFLTFTIVFTFLLRSFHKTGAFYCGLLV